MVDTLLLSCNPADSRHRFSAGFVAYQILAQCLGRRLAHRQLDGIMRASPAVVVDATDDDIAGLVVVYYHAVPPIPPQRVVVGEVRRIHSTAAGARRS